MTGLIPFRVKVIDNIAACIQAITPANGYINDLSSGEALAIGRLFLGDDEPVPMVAINEPPMAIEQSKAAPQNPNSFGDWDFLIQGWAENGPENFVTRNAYILVAEVRQHLALQKKRPDGRPGMGNGPNLLGMGPSISDLRIGAPVVRPPDAESAKSCFYLMLTLQISEDMTKPFG